MDDIGRIALAFDHSLPRNPADGAPVLVLLHGRGSHRGDLQALRDQLPANAALFTPQAPHPGHPWGYGPGWAWYRYRGEDLLVPSTLEESLAALGVFLDALPERLSFTPGPVFLGGFSQGGTTSLAFALRNPGRVAGVLNFSGFLPGGSVLDPAEAGKAAETTPVFWGHGRRDSNIPWALAAGGRERLERAGVPLEARDYDIGHWIAPEEVQDAVAWMEGLQTS